jgi:hypothetical protein
MRSVERRVQVSCQRYYVGATLPILKCSERGNDLTIMQERLLHSGLGEAYRPYWLTARARLRLERGVFSHTGVRPARPVIRIDDEKCW